MAQIEIDQGKSPEMKAMAKKIVSAQKKEIAEFDNVILNINQFYMAGLMTMPMVVMGAMYMDKNRNKLIIVLSCVALVVFFLLIRFQGGVSDAQFLKSMIP